MPKLRPTMQESEPVGIVISGGFTPEAPPRFWAYVWSDTPETDEQEPSRRAA
ncbi:MAG TPA: hypothetical protein VHQ45_09925 [Gemmatimonadaceae bacterium]|jgi:hypothetical protein|nr:hypothetical protein [Gemmatimonadaceae bacterium]